MIYDDFREYMDQNVNLCMLKTLNYQAGQKPDYSDIHIQQLYLLRYVFSYAFEYKSMQDVVNFDVLPMLAEYWFDDTDKLQRWENILHGVFQ